MGQSLYAIRNLAAVSLLAGLSLTAPAARAATLPALDVTNLPGLSPMDYCQWQQPAVGDTALHVLSPTMLEVDFINTKAPDPAALTNWNLVSASGQLLPPGLGAFAVTANSAPVVVTGLGYRRRPLYAPQTANDLRVINAFYLQLAAPVADGANVQVKNPDGSLWNAAAPVSATKDPLRYSPAIHVNQEGYLPNYAKKAMVGYYLGTLGELPVAATTFAVVEAHTGATVFSGNLSARPDSGWTYAPTPYQLVYEADFTGFNTVGEYRLQVPGLGASLPFVISSSIAMDFARTYALNLYHQRCGTNNVLPYTRFTRDVCHTAPASVPTSASAYSFTWTTVANYANTLNSDNPPQTAPALTSPGAALFPYVNTGPVDVSGGHHDAGDYSKYTENSAQFIHELIFAVDSFAGVASFDNLGTPESGDGISDLLQEAKWEADFLAKMQDSDGGFYFLVYPTTREYEANVTPDHGDPQVVWPKNSAVTAASVAALAECASSPLFKATYPAAAANYLAKAKLGWTFLQNAIARYGKNGIYQKITFYGDDFTDKDELAWAACEMYLATGDPTIQQTLFSWFPDPTDPATFLWGWWRMYLYYGNAVRSYAFAARSGRLPASALDANYLAKCINTITNRANDLVGWSQQSAYGTSFPTDTKHVMNAGWYFSVEQCYDIATAYQVNPSANYLTALVENMNYEGGCNPVNASYVTGLGWKRQRDIVSQYALNDRRISPTTGEPVGNVHQTFEYLWFYGPELGELVFPQDGAATAPYPFYDRWSDSWNVTAEYVSFQSARSLATYAFLAAQNSSQTQAWKAVSATISAPSGTLAIGTPATMTLQAPGIDFTGARVTWEIQNLGPVMAVGPSYTFIPQNNGTQWIEAEAQFTDGRRVFAASSFNADSPNTVWVDDAIPAGATAGADGGDSWSWVSSNPSPKSGALSQQSAIAAGEHQHFFYGATTTMTVAAGDVLYAWVYLDPANLPSEVMLEWNDGQWTHNAYWGANIMTWGTDGTASRRYMGPLPPAGQWVRLLVPASQVGLEGSVVNGMGFDLYNGRAWWDAAGVLNTNLNLSAAAVAVSATGASRVGPVPGAFTLTRTGDTSAALTVNYSIGGTAVPGTDYQAAQGLTGSSPSVTIPAGTTSATLNVTPMTSSNVAPSQTVVLALAANSNYSVTTPSAATLTIAGNAVPAPSLKLSASKPALSWASVNQASYRIAYKNKLTDASWTYVSGTLAGNGNTLNWSDTAATGQSSRFYCVIRVQ